jgi:hypothetical protein
MLAKLVLGLLPPRYKGLVEMGQRMVANLDTEQERAAAVAHFNEILQDGRVTPPEWASLGKTLKIWGK